MSLMLSYAAVACAELPATVATRRTRASRRRLPVRNAAWFPGVQLAFKKHWPPACCS